MTPFAESFDAVFLINLEHRTDRREQAERELSEIGLLGKTQWFKGHYGVLREGSPSGNAGCTASHRGVLEVIGFHGYNRALVLEDDFARIHPVENFAHYWSQILPSIPADWDLVYLGGHYAEAPKYRVNDRVIRCGRMLTTSSYIIKSSMARKMAPYIAGDASIDNLFSSFSESNNFYITQPRLFVQRDSFSDIQEKYCEHRHCMMDTSHERMV